MLNNLCQHRVIPEIIRKVRFSDSFPEVLDEFFAIECYLFGVWQEDKLKGKPKEVIAKRYGAIYAGTVDGVKEHRLPLIFDMTYKIFYENDIVKSIIFSDEVITVASLYKNAGAGGVFLGLACDYVLASEATVLNSHYKTIGLSGSEYHMYSLPKRVRTAKSKELLEKCLPLSESKAKEILMVDEVFAKENYLEENREYIGKCKEKDLKLCI